MTMTNDNSLSKKPREEEEAASDFRSDENAQHFDESFNEGGAYARANGLAFEDPEDCLDDQECEYRDPELYDPDEETLPPGEMELIFENSYIM
jgi:hypothetical protein